MASLRTFQQVTRLRSYVRSKYCAQPDCRGTPAPGGNLCIVHRDRQRRFGLPAATPLGLSQRRSYTRGFHTVLRKAKRTQQPSDTIPLVITELDSFLSHQCQYIPMDDISHRGLGADRKLRGLLANIRRRFPEPNQAAVNILASACGAWLAVEIEGDPACKHHPRYRQASIFGAIFSLARTPSRRRIIEQNGKPVLMKSRYRPWMTGRRIHEAVDKQITQRFVRFIMEDKAVRKAVLELILRHDYGKHYWA